MQAKDSRSGHADEQRVRFTFRGSQPLVRPLTKEIASQPPEFGEAYLLERLKQYRTLGRLAEAAREAEAALARTGLESTKLLNALAELYADAGNRPKALETLRRSLARDPNQAGVRARMEAFSTKPTP